MLTDSEHARDEMSNTSPRIACNGELLRVENRLKVGYGRKTALPLLCLLQNLVAELRDNLRSIVGGAADLLDVTYCVLHGLWLMDDNNGLTAILNAGVHPLT